MMMIQVKEKSFYLLLLFFFCLESFLTCRYNIYSGRLSKYNNNIRVEKKKMFR